MICILLAISVLRLRTSIKAATIHKYLGTTSHSPYIITWSIALGECKFPVYHKSHMSAASSFNHHSNLIQSFHWLLIMNVGQILVVNIIVRHPPLSLGDGTLVGVDFFQVGLENSWYKKQWTQISSKKKVPTVISHFWYPTLINFW